jgi:drug/metabolite transporter (DMT)-like permease
MKRVLHRSAGAGGAIPAVILSSILFGASTPLARALVGAMDPLWLAGVLYAGSGIGLSAWLVLRRSRGEQPSPLIAAADAGWLGAAILCGGILAPIAFAFGLRATTGAAASLLLNLESVFTVVLAWFLFGEHRNARVVLGMTLIVIACALLGGGDAPGSTTWTGVGLVALACLLLALDNNLTRKVAANDAVALAAAKGIAGGAVNIALAAALGGAPPAGIALAATAAVGLVGYGISLVLFVVGIRGLGVARASAYYGLAPFVGVAVAFGLLGEAAPPSFWPALALLGAGVWLHLRERHVHEHTHAPMAHSHPHTHDEHHRHAHDFAWDGEEPHVHPHTHAPITHRHAHYPDLHHDDHPH